MEPVKQSKPTESIQSLDLSEEATTYRRIRPASVFEQSSFKNLKGKAELISQAIRPIDLNAYKPVEKRVHVNETPKFK